MKDKIMHYSMIVLASSLISSCAGQNYTNSLSPQEKATQEVNRLKGLEDYNLCELVGYNRSQGNVDEAAMAEKVLREREESNNLTIGASECSSLMGNGEEKNIAWKRETPSAVNTERTTESAWSNAASGATAALTAISAQQQALKKEQEKATQQALQEQRNREYLNQLQQLNNNLSTLNQKVNSY